MTAGTTHRVRWPGPALLTSGSLTSGPLRSAPLTALAYGSLAVPFAIVLVRFAVAGDHRIFLPDDLALVDLHTRAALHWRQALGPFDRFGWNHPGPAYYYLLSIPYRIFGGGAGAAFFGATVINALAALAVVWICRRRGGPVLALWAAVVVGALELLLSINSAAAVTYSEGVLGAAVSPWTATVIVVPLLLFAVLCADAMTASALSLLGALLVGSFVVQTDFSAAPLVVVLFLLSVVVGVVASVGHRRRAVPGVVGADTGGDGDGGGDVAADVGDDSDGEEAVRRAWRGWVLAGFGVAVWAAMWIPPLVQNATTHPGNLDLIYRFFTAPHPGHSLGAGLWTVVTVDAVALFGPGEIMSTALGIAPSHSALAVVAAVLVVLVGAAAVVVGLGRRNRLAVASGALSLVGLVAMIVAFTKITGPIFGYLVLWEITLPTLGLLGLGAALLTPGLGRHRSDPRRAGPRRPDRSTIAARQRPAVRAVLGGLVVVTGLALCLRMVALPDVRAVSDPHIGAVVGLVTKRLPPSSGPLFVGDGGLGLVQTEEFVGVVNELDLLGYHPKVNKFWLTEFGSDYVVGAGGTHWYVSLIPWSPKAPTYLGYVGRVAGIGVTVSTVAPTLTTP